MPKLIGKKNVHFYPQNFCLSKPILILIVIKQNKFNLNRIEHVQRPQQTEYLKTKLHNNPVQKSVKNVLTLTSI